VAAFYLDESVSRLLARELVHLHHSAIHARDHGLAGATDARQLLEAFRQGWVLITDDRDFLALHAAWLEWPVEWQLGWVPEHHGILVINQGQLGGIVPAAQAINLHVATGPSLRNTLWHWTVANGWVQR
jgi:hypothetical protein